MVFSRVKALWKVIKSSRKENRVMKQYSECEQVKTVLEVYNHFLYKHGGISRLLMDDNTSSIVKNALQFVDTIEDCSSPSSKIERQMDKLGLVFVDRVYYKLPRAIMSYTLSDDVGYENASMKLQCAVMILKHLFDFTSSILMDDHLGSMNSAIPSVKELVKNCKTAYRCILVKATYNLNSRFRKAIDVNLCDLSTDFSYYYSEVMTDALNCDLSFDKQPRNKDKEDK